MTISRRAMENRIPPSRTSALGTEEDCIKTIALAGNPNVGKSTVFNSLTGLRQHTGNWPGKTVSNARGEVSFRGRRYMLVDIPGTYSLLASSAEEAVARDFICFGQPDAVVVVADSTCLERNLILLLQILELTANAVLCINLMDEAEKKNIHIDFKRLSEKLGIPVVGTSARSGEGLDRLLEAIGTVIYGRHEARPLCVAYPAVLENAVAMLEPQLSACLCGKIPARWASLKLLEGDDTLILALKNHLCCNLLEDAPVCRALHAAKSYLSENGVDSKSLIDQYVTEIVLLSERLTSETLSVDKTHYAQRDRRIDRLLTKKSTGIPAMLLLLFGIFWLTIEGANLPSALLASGFSTLEKALEALLSHAGTAAWLQSALIEGVWRTLSWVIAVMLPPMAIFFPLFTLLEDSGYLPRIAFNLDNYFRKACAHGKQALTMCMGFGCNAAGVTGCRIIDSPRERLIAIITNCFVPCNGRFPTLIAIITMFFAYSATGVGKGLVSTLFLMGTIVLSIVVTLLISRFLSKTLLRGVPSSFILELPPYRRPQFFKVIVRSILDRTLFVLSRAVIIAAPAGLIIWLLANISPDGVSLLSRCAAFLDPLGRLMGLDGYILIAFILGFPANEIVVPILIMCYLSSGALTQTLSLEALRTLFVAHGWTWLTALCMMLFSLMHWPCGTTLLTIFSETKSVKWTFSAFAIPTLTGILACSVTAAAARLILRFF